MKKTKHNPPKKKSIDPNFIQFSKVQRGFLAEISRRNQRDWDNALELVYDELGLVEKILKAPPGTYTMSQDLSGLDVLPVKIKVKEETEPEKAPESSAILKEKDKKDN